MNVIPEIAQVACVVMLGLIALGLIWFFARF
jgi:hypothetical protein